MKGRDVYPYIELYPPDLPHELDELLSVVLEGFDRGVTVLLQLIIQLFGPAVLSYSIIFLSPRIVMAQMHK